MSYQNAVNDKDKIQTGWGVMGSGTVHLNTNNSVMFQGVYGKGIANYIQDISSLGYDLIPKVDANGKLKAPSMWGIFGAIQHNWNPKLYSSFIYSYTRMENRGNLAKQAINTHNMQEPIYFGISPNSALQELNTNTGDAIISTNTTVMVTVSML